MTDTGASTQSIVEERLMPHPPEKVWRALTQPALIAQWLMQNDFKPEVGHRFTFRAKPAAGLDRHHQLRGEDRRAAAPAGLHTWGDGTETDSGLQTAVTWTLAPEAGGTRVRMEQSGFRPQDEAAYRGASYGWRRLVAELQRVAAELP